MNMTFYISYSRCGCARTKVESHTNDMGTFACTPTSSSSNNCNSSDILCAVPCRLCLFVVGLIICGWLAPPYEHPITHPTSPPSHTHTHSAVIKAWKQGCLFIEEALSTLHPLTQQSQHNATVNCIGHALWLAQVGSGRKERIWVVCAQTCTTLIEADFSSLKQTGILQISGKVPSSSTISVGWCSTSHIYMHITLNVFLLPAA